MGGAEEFFMREIEDAGQVRFFFKFLEETVRRDRELLLIYLYMWTKKYN